MKAVLLAGGNGTRLSSFTSYTSKQLLPVYDVPMVTYPYNTLQSLGYDEVALICKSEYVSSYWTLLGSKVSKYVVQDKPDGIPEAFKLAHSAGFLKEGEQCGLVLGDNLFFNYTHQVQEHLATAVRSDVCLFSVLRVKQPERYGVYDSVNNVVVEKPKTYVSDWAVPGFYHYPSDVLSKVRQLVKSERGETEVSHLNNSYLSEGRGNVVYVSCGWFDCGEYDSLLDAGNYVRALKNRGELVP